MCIPKLPYVYCFKNLDSYRILKALAGAVVLKQTWGSQGMDLHGCLDAYIHMYLHLHLSLDI